MRVVDVDEVVAEDGLADAFRSDDFLDVEGVELSTSFCFFFLSFLVLVSFSGFGAAVNGTTIFFYGSEGTGL